MGINEHVCITDGPGAYSANELAQITVNYDGMLDVIHFKTHDEYRVWNNGWTTMTYAQLYGGGNTKAPWWMHRNSAYYLGSYPSYYRNIAVGSGYEQYSSGDSGAISRQGSYRSYSKNGWYNDNWYFTDYLEVNGQRYHGPDSPDGVRVKAGQDDVDARRSAPGSRIHHLPRHEPSASPEACVPDQELQRPRRSQAHCAGLLHRWIRLLPFR